MGGRLGSIDVLRLLAAAGVLIFHVAAEAQFPKRVMPAFTLFGHQFATLPSPFTFGSTGVSLFFVISGFCLHRSLARPGWTVTSYLRARIARIYPAYALAVLFAVAVALVLGFRIAALDVVIKLLFLQGFVQDYHLTLNGSLWSMATEVQFYLALPWLFLCFERFGPVRAFAALALVCLLWRLGVSLLPGPDPIAGGIVRSTFLLNLLPGRLIEFTFGMLIAARLGERGARLALWSALPVLLLAALVKARGPVWLAEPLLGIGYGAVLAAAIRYWRLAEGSALAIAGRASYALFLFQVPAAALIAALVPLGDWAPYPRLLGYLALTLLFTMPLALAVYSYVELPAFRRWAKRRPAGVAMQAV